MQELFTDCIQQLNEGFSWFALLLNQGVHHLHPDILLEVQAWTQC